MLRLFPVYEERLSVQSETCIVSSIVESPQRIEDFAQISELITSGSSSTVYCACFVGSQVRSTPPNDQGVSE